MSFGQTSSRTVHVRAPGKINLSFAVGQTQADGYHEVASVYQAVSVYDDLWASASPVAGDDSIEMIGEVDLTGIPRDGGNLAVRAARLVAGHVGWGGGIQLRVHKRIPVAGGMGGGSADAAAALVAVNELLDAGLGSAELQELGARLGADVPFALLGGTAVGTSRGDVLAPALTRGRLDWVLAPSARGLSTPEVYGELDRLRALPDIAPDYSAPVVGPALLHGLRAGSPAAVAVAVRNDLQDAALSLRPELADTLQAGRDAGALAAVVSGSGPTIAFLAAGEQAAARLAATLSTAGVSATAVHGPVPGARVVPW